MVGHDNGRHDLVYYKNKIRYNYCSENRIIYRHILTASTFEHRN